MTKLPSGAALDIFDSLDSTSLEAKRRAEAGVRAPYWFVALRQTAGYGRRGRVWEQATGDFSGTLLIEPPCEAAQPGQLSFVTAISVASALDEYIRPGALRLKWPNDILLNGAKAAGILLERIGGATQPLIAIGIGVNIVSTPTGVDYPTARLVDHAGAVPSPEDFAARIDHHFWRYYRQWTKEGFTQTRRLWLERAAGIGDDIVVRLPNEEIAGIFDGIDETGALVLRSGGGKRTIAAGDVFFGA